MSHPIPPADPVSVLALVLGPLLGVAAAQIVGLYAAIMIGSFAGSLIALRRRAPGERMHAFSFVFIMMIWSTALTGLVALWVGKWIGEDWRWIVTPAAIVIAAIGENWVDIAKWGIGLLKAVWERRAQSGGQRNE